MIRFEVVLHRDGSSEDRFEHVAHMHRGYQWSMYRVENIVHTISPFEDECAAPAVHAVFMCHMDAPRKA